MGVVGDEATTITPAPAHREQEQEKGTEDKGDVPSRPSSESVNVYTADCCLGVGGSGSDGDGCVTVFNINGNVDDGHDHHADADTMAGGRDDASTDFDEVSAEWSDTASDTSGSSRCTTSGSVGGYGDVDSERENDRAERERDDGRGGGGANSCRDRDSHCIGVVDGHGSSVVDGGVTTAIGDLRRQETTPRPGDRGGEEEGPIASGAGKTQQPEERSSACSGTSSTSSSNNRHKVLNRNNDGAGGGAGCAPAVMTIPAAAGTRTDNHEGEIIMPSSRCGGFYGFLSAGEDDDQDSVSVSSESFGGSSSGGHDVDDVDDDDDDDYDGGGGVGDESEGEDDAGEDTEEDPLEPIPGEVKLVPSMFPDRPPTVFFEYPKELGMTRFDNAYYTEPLGGRRLLFKTHWERNSVKNAFFRAGFSRTRSTLTWTASWGKHPTREAFRYMTNVKCTYL